MKPHLTIDFFSPLPPLATDIGNHTAGVLDALRDMAKIRVWTSQEGPIARDIPGLEIHRFTPDALPFPILNQADATFYNIGNNAGFHRDIHAVARRVPGIVILHDTRLQHFFAAYSEQGGESRAYYLDQLERSHGERGRRMGQDFIDGRRDLQDLVDAAPMTLSALDNAIGGILHNAEEYEVLSRQTHLPLYYLPLSFRHGAAPTRQPIRDATAPSRLTMFGYIGENRRLQPILQALAAMPDRDRYVLDIYGVIEQEQEARTAIETSGLTDLVRLHGFVPEPVLTQALSETDLALNLRWPSMGEASGSQLRIWAACLPALVTRVGWYAQLPGDAVFRIDQAEEQAQIIHHLRALRDKPALYAEAGQNGRRILEQLHSPQLYAESLIAIAAGHKLQHARAAGHALAQRAASTLLGLGPANLARPLGGEVARRIADLTGA